MKRIALSTLSLALLSVTGVAHAQSSVTLYGLIDESIQYAHNTVDASGKNSNQVGLVGGNLQGNRFGLKGTEDLGGGLKPFSNWKTALTSTPASWVKVARCSVVKPTSA